MFYTVFKADDHAERLAWIKENCVSFYEYEYMGKCSPYSSRKVIYRFINEKDVILVNLKWI